MVVITVSGEVEAVVVIFLKIPAIFAVCVVTVVQVLVVCVCYFKRVNKRV